RDRELADWQDQLRTQQLDLGREPARAVGNLVIIRHAVAADQALAGEAAANRRKINVVARLVLAPTQAFLKPFEKRFPRGPRERSPQHRLLVTRRLTDQEDAAGDRAARDGWR